jgi:hypothetical protein
VRSKGAPSFHVRDWRQSKLPAVLPHESRLPRVAPQGGGTMPPPLLQGEHLATKPPETSPLGPNPTIT